MIWIDILLFAGIAGFFAWRLYTVLGERPDDLPPQVKPQPMSPQPDADIEVRARPIIDEPAPESLAGGLAQIRSADPSFDEKRFIAGAKGAYEMVLQAFAEGDLETLKSLLAPSVCAAFESALSERQEKNHRLSTKILRIKAADITQARLTGGKAMITVDFTSDQINTTHDASGNLIDGHATKPELVEDRWAFVRDIKSRDPNWLLVATGVQ